MKKKRIGKKNPWKYLPNRLVLNTKNGSSSDHPYLFLARILTSYSVFGNKSPKLKVPSATGPLCDPDRKVPPSKLGIEILLRWLEL